jgi:hypothetical protein
MKPIKLIRTWFNVSLLALTSIFILTEPVLAAITVTGSISTSTTNVPLQITTMQYGTAGIDLDLGQYIRFGLNYGLQVSSSAIYQPVENISSAALADSANPTCPTVGSCFAVINKSVVTERGFGFTLILWAGDVVMPYITVGGVVKKYTFSTQVNDGLIEERQGQTPPSVSLGAGLVLKLNRDFSLKLNIQASPGVTMRPGDDKPRMMWDKKNTIGLTYQLK